MQFQQNFVDIWCHLLFIFKAIKIGRYTIHHKNTNITEAKEAKETNKDETEKSAVLLDIPATPGQASSCGINDDLITADSLLDMAVAQAILGSGPSPVNGMVYKML